MIIVTGGAGFIGSNLVKALNDRGEKDIIVVDDLSDGIKFKNISDCDIADYLDKDDFNDIILNKPDSISPAAIYHFGACSDTTEWDGRYVMRNNYEYSKTLLNFSLKHEIPFLYASSASVYGAGEVFREAEENEDALNPYAYSKFLFDRYVRMRLPTAKSQIVGFRYFNVYGPREFHKGKMASVAFHLHNQLQNDGKVKLFEGCDGYGDGEQRRDFVYVDDAVDASLWFLENQDKSGIYNIGTGRSQTFNDIAKAVIAYHDKGTLEYISFPENLVGRYQSYTQADITQLRNAGYSEKFRSVEEGVHEYLNWLDSRG